MKKNNLAPSFVILLFFIVSCDKFIEYQYDVPPDKLVVFARLNPQKGLEVKLTHSIIPNGIHYFDEDINVEDASIILIVNDTGFTSVPHISSGQYTLDGNVIDIHPGNRYKLRVASPKYGVAESSEVVIPNKSIVTFLKYESDKRNINGDTCINAFFTISNSNTSTNTYYYDIKIPFDDYPWVNMKINDIESEICEMIDYSDLHFFTDKCMSKPTDTLELEIQNIYKGKAIGYFEINISSISESLYKYAQNAIQPEGKIELAYSEPRLTYMNFDNAYGVFYCENNQSINIHLK
jgi:hypothetical protein